MYDVGFSHDTANAYAVIYFQPFFLPAYPVLLNLVFHLSAALIALCPEEVEVLCLLRSHRKKRLHGVRFMKTF